ncbi:PPOX class F420-dependent oxidoreductase [Gordonia sp. OPL2]|uniref:PPOX class F420-dependent oxidoreductase n=1 Tax=Gordonia sp. OPL2 TaxID=2486274 RepID=UPI00165542B1|nr:PPOX class F420-dependent oxidoreductase [Gordonia sp. OPL2]ROZ98240.1 PPOX class F420-dependent oxidoreductase [Gordonia sp. OPL2]
MTTTAEYDPELLRIVADHKQSILITLRKDGRPQSSNVVHVWDAESGTASVSVTATRAKSRNVERDPRVSLHVLGDGFFSGYAVVEGIGELTPVAAAPDDETVQALVDYYRTFGGEHPDWDDYRRTMVSEQRRLLRIRPQKIYGMTRMPG